MDDIFNTRLSANGSRYKSSLERIIEKYSKLQDQAGGLEVDLHRTSMRTLERYMKRSKAEISKLESKSLTDLREESIREVSSATAPDVTRDSQLDFMYEEGSNHETCVSGSQLPAEELGQSTDLHHHKGNKGRNGIVVKREAGRSSRNNSTGVTVISLDESPRNISVMEVQPEDQDGVLELSLRSHGSSLVELYPDMIGRIGRAWRRRHVSEAAGSVLRRYRRWRRQTGRSGLCNTFVVPLTYAGGNLENDTSQMPSEEEKEEEDQEEEEEEDQEEEEEEDQEEEEDEEQDEEDQEETRNSPVKKQFTRAETYPRSPLQQQNSPFRTLNHVQQQQSPFRTLNHEQEQQQSPFRTLNHVQQQQSPLRMGNHVQQQQSPFRTLNHVQEQQQSPLRMGNHVQQQQQQSPLRMGNHVQQQQSPFRTLNHVQEQQQSPFRTLNHVQEQQSPFRTLNHVQEQQSPFRTLNHVQEQQSPFRTLNHVQQQRRARWDRPQRRPILIMDLSGPSETYMPSESWLNETFTVSEASRLGDRSSPCTVSPSRPRRPAAEAPADPSSGSRRLSLPRSLQAELRPAYASETAEERPDVYGSPVRPSPSHARRRRRMMMKMDTSLSRYPHGFPRSTDTYSGERSSREPSRPRLISTPPHKPAVPLRMLRPQDGHPSLSPRLRSPRSPAAAPAGRRHLSFDSALPSIRVSDSPKKLDEDFLKLYHKFVCQSKSSFFNRHPCRLCARSSEASRGPSSSSSSSSSSSLAALALSPHRSLLRKRHRELDRDGDNRSKRYRDERCPSSPGSQRHGKEMLRRLLSPADCGLSYSAGKPGVFPRFSPQQRAADQDAWMSRRGNASAADFSGMGSSLDVRRLSPRKW